MSYALFVERWANKFYNYSEFIANVNSGVGFGPQQTIGITQLMDTRTSYLLGLSDFTADAPLIGELYADPQTPQSGEETQFTIEIEDAEQAFLCWRTADFAGYTETELYDDGAHGDGAAGDDIFGAAITPVGNMMQYYIVADNSDASAFSPQRAAYEYNTLSIEYTPQENIAINEFMADNDNIIADEAGEYDDWLELFNLDDVDLDISGYYLSDDATSLDKWEIPENTILPANGFLCFWADEDQEQGDLHTNFKLSASGETILLSDALGNIIDEITYTDQTTDISLGRYPDGTGDFIEMTPSYMQANYEGITAINSDDLFKVPQISNYPNPFNPETTISFTLWDAGKTELRIYNISGQLVKTLLSDELQAGNHQYVWDGKNSNGQSAASGIYYYQLKTNGIEAAGKMVLLK